MRSESGDLPFEAEDEQLGRFAALAEGQRKELPAAVVAALARARGVGVVIGLDLFPGHS